MIWVCGVISNHIPPGHTHCPSHYPTQSHTHTFLIRFTRKAYQPSCCWFAGATVLTFLSWIQVSLPSTGFSVGGWATAQEFPRNGENGLQNSHIHKRFCFSTPYYCTAILRLTVHSSMCCSSFVSVALTCPLFLQISKILDAQISNKQKYNMWVWLWVWKWVWPVEKWLDLTSKTHIIFLARDIIWNVFLVFIQSLMHLSIYQCVCACVHFTLRCLYCVLLNHVHHYIVQWNLP